jgi:hypothetical protein
LIAPDQCVFCTGHFPHPLNSKKPADDFLYRDSPAIFYLLEIVSQAREVEKGTFYFSVDLRAVEEEQFRVWPLSTGEGRLEGGGLGHPDRQAVGPGN